VDYNSVEKKIEDFIVKHAKRAKAKGIVIGLSGGLDSALVATLSSRALGSENVLGVLMPSATNSPHDIHDARLIAEKLGIQTHIVPIKSILDSFKIHFEHHDERALGNLAARIRMCILYYYANHLNYLVAGTGNKSELSIGYFTKYGDGGCDLLPIGSLYKTEVRELAKSMGLPQEIVDRTPTAGLWPGQTDEGEIGMRYSELDKILAGKAENIRVMQMVASTEHKRKMPEVCKL